MISVAAKIDFLVLRSNLNRQAHTHYTANNSTSSTDVTLKKGCRLGISEHTLSEFKMAKYLQVKASSFVSFLETEPTKF